MGAATEREGELFDELPLVLGETIAWRAWTVIAEHTPHPRLRSATHASTMWPTNRWTVAICPAVEQAIAAGVTPKHPRESVPDAHCSCGLYAAADLDHLLDYGYAKWSDAGVTAIGQVGFAGKVVPGSQGWRAARGRIVRLYVPFSQAALGAKLSKAYNVPVDFGPWWATDPRLRPRIR